MTDEEIVNAVREGNLDAYEELVKRHESRVAATVIGMLGNCPEADDVGQETFIRFFQNIKKFRGESSVGTYLTRIAINLSLNELKRRKRRRNRFSEKSSDQLTDVMDNQNTNLYNDEKETVQQAIQKLEPKFRSVVVLRLIEGYSTKEAAEILKVPVGTILSRLTRAQMKLREMLSPYYGGRYE